MKKETIIVLLESFFDDKVEQLKSEITPIRGARGLKGPKGQDFDFEEHKSEIQLQIQSYVDQVKEDLKLKFDDLTEAEKDSLTPEKITDITDEVTTLFLEHKEDFKLKFSDLTNEEKESLQVRGSRGQKGTAGKDFKIEEHREEIYSQINILLETHKEDLKLKFNDLTEDEKSTLKLRFKDLTEDDRESLRGATGSKGVRGKTGKDFDFDESRAEIASLLKSFVGDSKEDLKLKFDDLTSDEKNTLKLKFKDLTDEEVESLKVRGSRGQKGKSGRDFKFEDHKEDISTQLLDHVKDERDNLKLNFSDLTDDEKKSLKGKQGLTGVMGLRGSDGSDGKTGNDAPKIIDVQLEKTVDDDFYIIFYFSDGSTLETNDISLPSINYYSSFTASGGGGSSLTVQEGGVEVGSTGILNFDGNDFSVTYDPLTKKSTVEITGGGPSSGISVLDDGVLVSDSATSLDFIGDGVSVLLKTYMGDWVSLSEVTAMADIDPNYLRIIIPAQEEAQYLTDTKICNETINNRRFVTAVSDTHVALAQRTDASKSVVMGLALESGLTGESIKVLLFGKDTDTVFDSVSVNQSFFLDTDGQISTSFPSNGYLVKLGHGNGNGSGFVKIEEPIEI